MFTMGTLSIVKISFAPSETYLPSLRTLSIPVRNFVGVNKLSILGLYEGFHTLPPHCEHVENEGTNRGQEVESWEILSLSHFWCELDFCSTLQMRNTNWIIK